MHLAVDFAYGPKSNVHQKYQISQKLFRIMEETRHLPNYKEVNKILGHIQHRGVGELLG